jgi:hypothetical protein
VYRRKLIHKDFWGTEEEGMFCHLVLELCDGESSITHGVDFGHGDLYRLMPAPEWCDYKGNDTYNYNNTLYSRCGPHSSGDRAYSPINPMNENTAQFIMKVYRADEEKRNCTRGVNCNMGLSELACMHLPVGSELLMTKVPHHDPVNPNSTNMAHVANFNYSCGSGPYTVNFIGQGVALTETHPGAINALLNPISEDGCVSPVEKVNVLWANSYWSNAAWAFEETNSTDLARSFVSDIAKHGKRVSLMHSISRENRPEASYGRINNAQDLAKVFNLPNTTKQSPNIKWHVVGSSGYKKAMYGYMQELGFDLAPCPGAENKGSPVCGPNSLYENAPPGLEAASKRSRSALFKHYEAMLD